MSRNHAGEQREEAMPGPAQTPLILFMRLIPFITPKREFNIDKEDNVDDGKTD
jgi:hypothetical protein